MDSPEELGEYLTASRLAGPVGTSLNNTRSKIAGLHEGDPRCNFGLTEYVDCSGERITMALARFAGASLDSDDAGYIDPDRTLEGIASYTAALARIQAGSRILLATGHPAGLLDHYSRLASALERAGSELVSAHDDGPIVATGTDVEPARTIRFVAGVGCIYQKPGSLVHSHLSGYMDTMLAELDREKRPPDVVIADHGMAGAAIRRGITTLAIADVNDIPLLLAADDARIEALIVIDDNRPSRFFRVVTDHIIARAGLRA